MIDVVLAGGEVIDGSGGGAFRADVGIQDGRIACIGDLSGQESVERIELNGLAVCPWIHRFAMAALALLRPLRDTGARTA